VSDKDRAARLLKHYFRTVWERAGLGWTSDNEAELDDLAELLTRPLAGTVNPDIEARAAWRPTPAELRAEERDDGQVTEWDQDIGGYVTH